jgi:hypothetical protein
MPALNSQSRKGKRKNALLGETVFTARKEINDARNMPFWRLLFLLEKKTNNGKRR